MLYYKGCQSSINGMALNLLDLPVGQDNEEDDEGEFCPCAFSDDEEEDHGEHDDVHDLRE